MVVEVDAAAPAESDLVEWDHKVEASLDIPTGRLAIGGCRSYLPEASSYQGDRTDLSPHIDVPTGTHRVRVYSGRFHHFSSGPEVEMDGGSGRPSPLGDWFGATRHALSSGLNL